MSRIKKIIQQNKVMIYSAIVALVAIFLVLVFIRQEVDRFIFIMPIFAGWILFNILMLPDEEELESTDDKKRRRKKK